MELLTKLGIQWGLLIAQIVTFLIVAGVLGFFIYKPILKLLDDRTERIRAAAEKAKKLEEQAKEMEAIRIEKLKKIDAECGKLLETAKKQAEQVQTDILERASKEAALALLELKGLKSAIRIFPRLLKEASIALGGSEPVTVVFASKEHAEQSMHSLAAALKALPRSADIAAQHVEPSLIGGVRVEIGDERLEYTVRSLLLTAMQDLRNPSPQ